jgi:hypothetical protein
MIIGVTGASGFVGRALCAHLGEAGHEIRALSTRGAISPETLATCEAVVHLAGEPVGQRWTSAARERILASRVEGTRRLVDAMRPHPPRVLVSASAVGYYGSRGEDVLLESEPPSNDFLGQVAAAWEREAIAAETLGVRVARIRIGMVLGRGGGALEKMSTPFRLGLGGRIGNGRQWMSWIHLQDLVRLIAFLLPESTVRGVFNAVSPHPVRNAEFTRALAAALHRPAVFPIPAFLLKLLFGEMAQVLLASQRAMPDAITRAGFTFDYPEVFGALAEIYG